MKIYNKILSLLGTQKRKKEFFLILALILIGTLMEMLGIGIIIPVLAFLLGTDVGVAYPMLTPVLELMGNPSQKQLVLIGITLMVALYLIKFIFLIFLSYRQGSFVYGVQADLSRSLLVSYLYKPYVFHLQRNSAQLIRNATTEVGVYSGVVSATLSLITEALLLIGVVALLLVFEPLPALILIVSMSVFTFVFHYFTKNRLLQWGKDRQFLEGKCIQYLQQGLGGIKDAKVLGRESYFLNQYDESNLGKAQVGKKQYVLQQLPRFWLEFLVVAGLGLLVFILLQQEKSMQSIIPTLGLFGVASFRLMPAANKLLSSVQRIRYGIPVVETLYDEVDEIPPKIIKHNDFHIDTDIPTLKNVIKVNHVNFSYPDTKEHSLKGVCISVPRGHAIGLIGKSGAGKSTLVDIILGLLQPSSGNVEIDGININLNVRAWQDKIGYVPQTIFLTDDTLRNNIALGVSECDIDETKLSQAISDAQLEEYIEQLPIGLDTEVGERGVRISGGQRQRIGIARALYHGPEVLILDEATSSLDVETEKKVIDVITNLIGKKTIIIISHRFSAIKCCNNIYRLDSGKITQAGNYNQIINTFDDD